MREISIRTLLEKQREDHTERYHNLEQLVNLRTPERYDEVSHTSLGRYQHLRAAGFPSESLLDELTQEQVKRLAQMLHYDATRVFLLADIDYVVRTYGLRCYRTQYYKGKAWQAMEKDLQAFQQQVLKDDPFEVHTYRYSVIGASPALDSHPVAASRTPLLFFHLGANIYFLVSTYQSWVPAVRRILCWPLARYFQGIVTWIICFSLLLLGLSHLPLQMRHLLVIPAVFTYWILSMAISLMPLLRRRNHPDNFPAWLNRFLYKLLPY